jgi:hypothetical protein
LGGVALLAAFLIEIATELNTIRLILFNLGAIAIVVGVYRRLVSPAPRWALLAAAAALIANGWYLAMVVIATGQSRPFAGDFGLVWFFAGMAMWLGDAWFGFAALHLGADSRVGALVLAIGSLLAFTGMDRLGLNPPDDPTIFGPISLAGVALNGMGWVLLGLAVATRPYSPAGLRRGQS